MRAFEHPDGVYTGDYGPDGAARLWFTPEPGAARQPVPVLLRHSPNGVAWGYAGNGAADTARSILAHATDAHLGESHYQDFKREVVAQLPLGEPFRLPPEVLQRWLAQTGIVDRPSALVGRPASYPAGEAGAPFSPADERHEGLFMRVRQRELELDQRERRLDQRERRLDARAAALEVAGGIAPAWTAPAETIRGQLEWYMQVTGDPPDLLAKGLDLDPEWVTDVLAGIVTEIDLDHVQQLCESLHCNPFDLWGTDVGRSLLHAYGPEIWPTDMQAIPGGFRDATPSDQGPHPPPPRPTGPDLGL